MKFKEALNEIFGFGKKDNGPAQLVSDIQSILGEPLDFIVSIKKIKFKDIKKNGMKAFKLSNKEMNKLGELKDISGDDLVTGMIMIYGPEIWM